MFYFFDSFLSLILLLLTVLLLLHPCVCVCSQSLSLVQLFASPWTVPHQASLSVGFSKQKYESRCPFPPPGHLPDPGVESTSPSLAGRFFNTASPRKNFYLDTGLFDPDCHVFCFLFISPSFSFYPREEFLTFNCLLILFTTLCFFSHFWSLFSMASDSYFLDTFLFTWGF